MWNQVRKLRNDPTFKYGVPMLLLIVGGSFGLREFTQIRYDAKQSQIKVDPEMVARLKSIDHDNIIQLEYKKLKDMDLDGWKNIRGPRPWEK